MRVKLNEIFLFKIARQRKRLNVLMSYLLGIHPHVNRLIFWFNTHATTIAMETKESINKNKVNGGGGGGGCGGGGGGGGGGCGRRWERNFRPNCTSW